jgi:hypothetical protein
MNTSLSPSDKLDTSFDFDPNMTDITCNQPFQHHLSIWMHVHVDGRIVSIVYLMECMATVK